MREGSAQKKETKKVELDLTGEIGERVRGMLGDLTPEEWNNVQEGIRALRDQIDKMEWFSYGPNTVTALKNKQRWTELALAPKDSEHAQLLEGILSYLRIYPWKEMRGNVDVLVIENPRDMHLLREMLLFEYVREHMKGEGRQAEMEKWIDKKKRARMEDEAKERAEEQEYMLRLTREDNDFVNRKKERELRIIEYLQTLPVPRDDFETPVAIPSSPFHRFGYPRVVGKTAPTTSSKSKEVAPPRLGEETLLMDADVEALVQAFDEGRINEDALDKDVIEMAEVRGTRTPNLKLFPKKYEWVSPDGKKRKALRERETGRFLEEGAEQIYVDIAQAGLKEGASFADREKAFRAVRELALMHRGLILYVMREVLQRNPHADPDELFQGGLKALFRTVELHNKEAGKKFISYLVPFMEGYMRRIATETKFRDIHVPIHRAQSRARYHEAVEAVRDRNPDKAVKEADVLSTLASQGVVSEFKRSFDNFVRIAYLNYEKVGLDELEKMAIHDVDLRGESVFGIGEGEASFDLQELKEEFSQVLLRLTPREERVLRLRFEMGEERDRVAEDVYEQVGKKFLPGLSIAEVKKYIHELGEAGPLMDDEVFQNLSLNDQKIVANYVALLEKRGEDETLERVGNRYGVTKERIRGIEAKALRKLKHPSRTRALRQFLWADYEDYLSVRRKEENKRTQIYKQGWVDAPPPNLREKKRQ